MNAPTVEPLVLQADNHLLALAKPAGMPSVPDGVGSGSPSVMNGETSIVPPRIGVFAVATPMRRTAPVAAPAELPIRSVTVALIFGRAVVASVGTPVVPARPSP